LFICIFVYLYGGQRWAQWEQEPNGGGEGNEWDNDRVEREENELKTGVWRGLCATPCGCDIREILWPMTFTPFVTNDSHIKFITFEVRLCISWTKPDSQWNPDYKQFYWVRSCGNKPSGWYQSTRDLYAWNVRLALEEGCRKQTPSASILFFRANLLYFPHIKM